MSHANRGNPHSKFGATTLASLGSPSAWLAAAVPVALGAVLAAAVAQVGRFGRASIVDGRLEVLGTEPAWWSVAALVGGLLLVLGVVAGVAAASRVAGDLVDRRPPSVRRAWRQTLASVPLVLVVTVITALGVGAIALGASTALALVDGLVVIGLVVVAILALVGMAVLAPLALALPTDALAGGGLRALPRTFAITRKFNWATSGLGNARVTIVIVLGLAAGALAIAAPWGGSLLLVALVTFVTTIVVLAWTVFAAGVWTGIAADGLEALGREPAEGRSARATGGPRRLLLAAGSLALAPLLTAAALAVPSGTPTVERQELAWPPIGGPTIASYGESGVAALSMRGLSGFGAELSLCRSGECRTLEMPDMLTIAMSATPQGDLVFARWRRAGGSPELVLTRLTPSEIDALIDDSGDDDSGDDDIPDRGQDSRWIGEEEGPGATVLIERYAGEFDDPQVLDLRGQRTTMIAVDATGSTPVIASLEGFPKSEEGQRSEDNTPTITAFRCDDVDCASTSTLGTTGLTWSNAVDGSGPTLFDVAADDDRAVVALASEPTREDPVRLFTFADGAEPTVASLADPLPDNSDLVGDDTAGLSVALRPDGLATVLWRLPTQSSLWLASCRDDPCTDWTEVEIDPGLPELRSGPSAALAIDDSGRPLVAVATPDGTLALLDCLDAECAESTRVELVEVTWFGAALGLTLDGDRPVLLADGADPTLTTPRLSSQVVRCLEARCG